MQIIRNDVLIQRRKKTGQIASAVGIVVLLAGFALSLFGKNWDLPDPVVVFVPVFSLLVGFILSQVGAYYMNRFISSPRPDELVDIILKGLGKDYKLYHYHFPVPHLLLAPSGLVLPIIRVEGGAYTLDAGKWRQRFSAGRILNFMGRESLGNPAKDADYHKDQLDRFLKKHAPDLVDIPIYPVVVFLAENVQLNIKGEIPIPVVRAAKFKGLLRSGVGKPLPKATLNQLEEFLDQVAGLGE